MAWSFGDGFELYATSADMVLGYWDSSTAPANIDLTQAGRFAGSRAVRGVSIYTLVKSSGVNDAVHHFVLAFEQTAAISGTTLGFYLQLLDGTTAQCSVVFRTDGAILLTSGGPTGTTLATYAGAFPVTTTWYAFEIEVVINNATGSFTVRKNGNPSNDFTLGSLNTRGGTSNNYANKLQIGVNAFVAYQLIDDMFWRSDASSVAWLGDIRCYTRMPASDASVQFSRTPGSATVSQTAGAFATTTKIANNGFMSAFTAAYSGTISSGTVSINAGGTGNMKAAIYDATRTTVLATSNAVVNPVTGSNAITFATPLTVTKGATYHLAFDQDFSITYNSTGSSQWLFTTTYSSFPAASPTLTAGVPGPVFTVNITLTINAELVNEAQQDATTSYVYDSTPGHADFYGIGSIASTPVSTFMVTTRGYMQKSDAGTRTAAVQLKSGATTVASSTLTLTTSGWLWAWRTDLTDPNTSAPWTAAAVNNITCGPVVVA